MLAMGSVQVSSGSLSVSGYFYDGRSLSSVCTATGAVMQGTSGTLTVTFNSGLLPSGYLVFISVNGSRFVASVTSRSTNYFQIYIENINNYGAYANGNIDFMIMAPDWYYK